MVLSNYFQVNSSIIYILYFLLLSKHIILVQEHLCFNEHSYLFHNLCNLSNPLHYANAWWNQKWALTLVAVYAGMYSEIYACIYAHILSNVSQLPVQSASPAGDILRHETRFSWPEIVCQVIKDSVNTLKSNLIILCTKWLVWRYRFNYFIVQNIQKYWYHLKSQQISQLCHCWFRNSSRIQRSKL